MPTTEDTLVDDDREAITALLHRYCDHLDAGEWEPLADLFVEAGVLSSPRRTARSRAEIVEFMRHMETLHTPQSGRHVIGTPIISIDGDRAYVATALVFIDLDQGEIALTGTYLDRLTRRGSGWRFEQRIVRVDTQSTWRPQPADRS
jgi:SnoaL-like domain